MPAAKKKASKPANGENTEMLAPDEGMVIPRMKMGETGFLGLRISSNRILEESNTAFRYPQFTKTVNEMRNNPTVGAAMNVYRMMISRVQWRVDAPVGATETEIERAKFIESCMHDMDGSWAEFIESVLPYLEYGFAINEKVLRRRLYKNGSKWNDGFVGIKKLATRNPDTITGWKFTENGADLVAVEQSLQNIENSARYSNLMNENGFIEIPREKFLLFSASSTKGNPQGNSLFRNIYLSYKQLSLLQDQELLSVAKDVQGMLKIGIPPKYLDPNASAEDKAVVEAFKAMADGYNNGTLKAILAPILHDPESKLPMFTYDLLESKGGSRNDVGAIIKRLQMDILSALSVDVLRLGSDGSGSFSLAESKTSILAMAIDYRLREISEVLNNDLMRTLYEMNGWETNNLPKFEYDDAEDLDITSLSSAIQRIFAVSAVEIDRPILNLVREALGVAPMPDDMPVRRELLPANMTGQQTHSGEGMKSGAGDGTRKNAISGAGDSSVANKEN